MSPGRVELTIGSDYPVLSAFMCSRARVSVIRGPLGSGKTIGCAQRLLAHMIEQEPTHETGRAERRTRWLAIRNTYLDLEQTTIRDFLEVFQEGPMGRMVWGAPPTFEARFRLEDGSCVIADVIFLAMDRPQDVQKLKGYQVTGAWLNELSELHKAGVDMVDLRHGRYPSDLSGGVRCTWHGMFADTNSFDTRHWLYPLEQHPPEGWEFHRQPGGVLDTGETGADGHKIWRANPEAENLANLPDGYYTAGLAGKTDDWIHVMLANEFGFTVQGKPVHPRFVHSRHVALSVLEPDRSLPILFGCDFGRTPSGVVFQYHAAIDRYRILNEMPTQDMSAALFAPAFFRFLHQHYGDFLQRARGWGDPAGDRGGQEVEATCIDICRAAGLPMQAAPSNIAALRRAAIDNPLTRSAFDGGPSFLVSPNCEVLIAGLMGGYHYRQLQVSGADPRYSDEPEKNFYSHTAEACEYGLLGAGEGRAAIRPAEPQLRNRGPVQRVAISEFTNGEWW